MKKKKNPLFKLTMPYKCIMHAGNFPINRPSPRYLASFLSCSLYRLYHCSPLWHVLSSTTIPPFSIFPLGQDPIMH